MHTPKTPNQQANTPSDPLIELYEQSRTYLIHSEVIGEGIKEIKNKRLRAYLLELFQTAQAGILILEDFLFQASTCEDSDIDSLIIDCTADDDFDHPKFEVN